MQGKETKITLTHTEKWFIRCAIALKDAVLPLDPDNLDDETFEKDYGISKKDVEAAITSLKKKINIQ